MFNLTELSSSANFPNSQFGAIRLANWNFRDPKLRRQFDLVQVVSTTLRIDLLFGVFNEQTNRFSGFELTQSETHILWCLFWFLCCRQPVAHLDIKVTPYFIMSSPFFPRLIVTALLLFLSRRMYLLLLCRATTYIYSSTRGELYWRHRWRFFVFFFSAFAFASIWFWNCNKAKRSRSKVSNDVRVSFFSCSLCFCVAL